MSRFLKTLGPCVAIITLMGWALGCRDRANPSLAEVRIDAAASISHVIEALADDAQRDLGVRITVNAAASGTLVQQISQGDRADLFISADTRWMDHLAKRGLIDEASRINLAGNRLVLVGLAGSGIIPNDVSALREKRYQPIAIGDPAYVPAGRYALQALQANSLNTDTRLTLAEAPDARAALAFVLTGQCPVGVVYASDALKAPPGAGVQVLLKINPADHDPIRYPAAVLTDAPNPKLARRVLRWLSETKVQQALHDAGFEPG